MSLPCVITILKNKANFESPVIANTLHMYKLKKKFSETFSFYYAIEFDTRNVYLTN